ncbi:MAG TPA: substrate-binding domain-containing protein, partial [Kiritimatiellia bacterium]|nr:substrate-binding domain-containing protein [Kiritimatiellia bacterium]
MKAKVLLILPSDKFLHRQIIEGVLAHGREHGPWQFHFETGDRYEQALGKGRNQACSGIIALVRERSQLAELLTLNKPIVLINPPSPLGGRQKAKPPPHAVYVNRNQEDVGKTAAEYFLERGYRQFAFVGTPQAALWCERRLNGFCKRLADAGFSCNVYTSKINTAADDFSLEAKALSSWLKKLHPGTALYVVRDRRALQVLEICSDIGISVPETISVLSTDNDVVLCESTSPSLSSIFLNGENCGQLCARLLDRLLRKRKVEPFVDLAFPQVITRQSTDNTLIPDPFLAKALAIIRKDLSVPHTIEEIAQTLNVSRRTLELKARLVLGKTLKEEIDSIRLNEAVRLLANSSEAIVKIASKCGFCGASHLNTRLKTVFGYGSSVFRY